MFMCLNLANIVQKKYVSCKKVQSTDSQFFFQCLKGFSQCGEYEYKPYFFSSSQRFCET